MPAERQVEGPQATIWLRERHSLRRNVCPSCDHREPHFLRVRWAAGGHVADTNLDFDRMKCSKKAFKTVQLAKQSTHKFWNKWGLLQLQSRDQCSIYSYVLDNQDFRPRETSKVFFFICPGWLLDHCLTDWLSRNGLSLDWISFFIANARAWTLSIQRSRVDFLMKKIYELKYLTVLSQRLAVHSNAVVSNIRFQSLSIIKHPNPHIVIEGKTFIQHVHNILENRN